MNTNIKSWLIFAYNFQPLLVFYTVFLHAYKITVMILDHTIVALATPSGVGAIAIIRLSGRNAITIVDGCFKSVTEGKSLINQKTHTIHLGHIFDNEKTIDEVLVSVFKNPMSYTGEDIVEISCHGSNYVQQEILNLLIKKGARLASPGEFTLRAYLNGKMDLSQAEAVADLIASESKAQHELAIKQMRGGFSEELKALREQLVNFTALIELELDFSEEDVEFADRTEFLKLIHHIKNIIKKLIDSFAYGNVIKQGVPVAIVGKPNAGKSSLLNTLFNEEKAIVSHIAGTTRDSIEDTLIIDGIPFRFIDTAGLRKTDDTIEAIGVERAKAKINDADIILFLYDFNDKFDWDLAKELSLLKKPLILAMSKMDTIKGVNDHWELNLNKHLPNAINFAISSKTGQNITELKHTLADIAKQDYKEGVVVSNSRHKDSLEKALASLQRVEAGLNTNLSGDLLSLDIREALQHIGEITGEVDIDTDILGTIFGKFCIGK